MIYKTNNWHLFTFTTLLVLLPLCHSRAVSGINRSIRMIRDVYPELVTEKPNGGNQVQVCIFGDVVYGSGETVASPDPCKRCECRPPGVECNPVTCPAPQSGCRVLHRPDQCCPQYQCECTHAGRTYANGERVNNASKGPCVVCYCRGGLIQCATIGCYKRDDCEPVNVPGQCCPKYDHCPPRDTILDNPHQHDSTSSNITNNDTDNDQVSGENILIKNTSQASDSDLEESSGSGDIDGSITEDFLDTLSIKKVHEDSQEHHKISVEKNPNSLATFVKESAIRTDEESFQSGISDINFPQITIKEILPERNENPLVAPPKREINFEHNSSSEELNAGSTVESINSDQKPDSQESKEVVSKISNPLDQFEEVNTNETNLDVSNEVESENINKDTTDLNDAYSPVLRIGDQLLILKQGTLVPRNDDGTTSSVITIIGAEGLQPGVEENEDSIEEHGDFIPEQADEQASSNETSDSNVSIPAVLSNESITNPKDYLSPDWNEKSISNDASLNSRVSSDIQNNFDSTSIDVSSGLGPDSVPINIEDTAFGESSVTDSWKKDVVFHLPSNSDVSSEEKQQTNLSSTQSTQTLIDIEENDVTTEESEEKILDFNTDLTNSSGDFNKSYVSRKDLEIIDNKQDSVNKQTTEKSSSEVEADQIIEDSVDAALEHNPEYPPLPEDLGISDRLEDTTYTDFFENSEKSNLNNSTNQETENQTSSTDTMEIVSTSTESPENILNLKAALPSIILNKHASSDDYVNDEEPASVLNKDIKDNSDIETLDELDKINSDESSTVTASTTVDSSTAETENSTVVVENKLQAEVIASSNIEPKIIDKDSDLITKDNFDIIAESSFIHEDKMLSDSSKDSNLYNGNTVVKKNLSGTGNNIYNLKGTNSSEHYKIIERNDPTDMEVTESNSAESVETSTDSGEHMTERNQQDALLSNEDASIEILQDNSSDIKDDFEMVLPLVEDVLETKNYGIDPIDTVLNNKPSEKNLEDVEFIQVNSSQQEFVHFNNKTHESAKSDESTDKNHKNEVNSESDADISTESIKLETESSTQDGIVLGVDDIAESKHQENFDGSVLSAIRDFFQNQYRETE